VKERWEKKKLGDVCKFVRGPFGSSLKKSNFVPYGYAVYEQQHAINNQFHSIRYFIDDQKFKEMQRFEIFPGDIIMSCSGTMGKVAIVPHGVKRGIINQALLKLKPAPYLDAVFLKLWMESKDFLKQIEKYSKGAAIKNVSSVRLLKEINILLPPLPEQKRIVAILDEVFAGIDAALANTEKNLANARELFESYLNAIFNQAGAGWEEQSLAQVCQINPQKKEVKSKLDDNTLVSFVPMEQLGLYSKVIGLEIAKPLGKVYGSYTYFAENDVLLAKITPCFENGKLGIARGLSNGVGFGSSEFIVFRCKDCIIPDYLFYFLSNSTLRKSGARVMTGAVGHKRIPMDFIESYKLPIPTIPEQKRIVAQLDELSAASKRLEASIDKNKRRWKSSNKPCSTRLFPAI
jgi:type I restriction enzyme S subunit